MIDREDRRRSTSCAAINRCGCSVGDVHATLNGMPLTLKHAPFRVRGRVMVALNVVARAFNVRATYDPRTARIDVLTPGIGQAPPAASTPASMQ